MVKWSDYLDKCFLVGGSQQSTNFIRSQFDYGVRQRRVQKGYSTHSFSITVSYDELISFETLWADLNDGTDAWLTDNIVHGNLNADKTVRFISGYTLEERRNHTWSIGCSIELIEKGTPKSLRCPLVPSYGLSPTDGLTPC